MDESLVTVASYVDVAEAKAAEAMLVDHGITATLVGRDMFEAPSVRYAPAGFREGTFVGISIDLRVEAEDATRARTLLHPAIEHESDGELRCPRCDSGWVAGMENRWSLALAHALMPVLVGVLVLGALALLSASGMLAIEPPLILGGFVGLGILLAARMAHLAWVASRHHRCVDCGYAWPKR